MSIKVTIDEGTPVKEKPFPKVMVNKKTGSVVLFKAERRGTVLRGSDTNGFHKAGFYSEDWDMSNFEDFTGTITMECN